MFMSRLKPDSAQQLDRDIYIGTRDYTKGKQDSPMQSPGNSMISFNERTKDNFNRRRKTSLPMIQGVNEQSLSLLIDQPEKLMQSLTPLHRRGLGGRNFSLSMPKTTINSTAILSPSPSSIVNSARREISGINFNTMGAMDSKTIVLPKKDIF